MVAGPADPLEQPVYVDGGYKPFGELTLQDVRARAHEFASAGGVRTTAKVASVARAWSALARQMSDAGATTVADLGTDAASACAERLWVAPGPGQR